MIIRGDVKKWFMAVAMACVMLAPTLVIAESSPALLKAKKEAEAKGYVFFTTHDEIVAKAKKEGSLSISCGMDPANYKPLVNAFKQKYPFLTDINIAEVTIDTSQKFLLEIKAGQAKGWDVIFIPPEIGKDYMPYVMKHDILGMARNGVLKINPRMVHTTQKNIVGVTSAISAVAYNRKLISDDKVPAKWEDFLKPEFKGRKLVVDIRPLQIGSLVPLWGLKRTLDFAKKLAAQQPIWAKGGARLTLAVATGEYALYLGPNFSTVKRAMMKDPTGNLNYKIVEPVATNIAHHSSGIVNTADHPHAALLWLEFLASPEGQEIIDKYEPLKASIFTPGSVVAKEIQGKEISLVNWDHFTDLEGYVTKVFEAFGFPKADK
jgi:iron(III) transport system substrate-binding protein